ncbi:hypothetical protein [Renibacterium salmoninarum]
MRLVFWDQLERQGKGIRSTESAGRGCVQRSCAEAGTS